MYSITHKYHLLQIFFYFLQKKPAQLHAPGVWSIAISDRRKFIVFDPQLSVIERDGDKPAFFKREIARGCFHRSHGPGLLFGRIHDFLSSDQDDLVLVPRYFSFGHVLPSFDFRLFTISMTPRHNFSFFLGFLEQYLKTILLMKIKSRNLNQTHFSHTFFEQSFYFHY